MLSMLYSINSSTSGHKIVQHAEVNGADVLAVLICDGWHLAKGDQPGVRERAASTTAAACFWAARTIAVKDNFGLAADSAECSHCGVV